MADKIRKHIWILFVAMLACSMFAAEGWALETLPSNVEDDGQPNTVNEQTCTFDPGFNVPNQLQIITSVVDGIICILYGAQSGLANCDVGRGIAQDLFETITQQGGFQTLITALATLFVSIFGILFMFGIVQLTISEFLNRAFKFSVVVFMLSPFAWNFFYGVVGVFFQNGTDWLIARSTQVALGTIPGINPNAPFAILDYAVATAFSAKMFTTIVATLFTGPYGWLFGFLMITGLGSFVSALFQGIWIYLMSSIVRAFLFSLAPIFLAMLLFQRTRHLFDGWLNQLINSMLQPVFLFTFFSFFVVLVQAAMENILRVEVCYVSGAGFFKGVPGEKIVPQPVINGDISEQGWGFLGAEDLAGSPTFFIDIVDVLIFILLTQLAWRFNTIAINIAKELAGVSITFNVQGAIKSVLSPQRAATGRLIKASNEARPKTKFGGGGAGGNNAAGAGGAAGVGNQVGGLANQGRGGPGGGNGGP